MRIVVLGAGIIGITTAYELARSGQHQITVVDTSAEAATEASAVNASMIAPGHAFAWASPKVPGILMRSLYRNDQAFRIRLRVDRQFWKWTALFLKECNAKDAERNTVRKHALCQYSQQRLATVVAENSIEYDRIQRGLIYLFRNSDAFRKGVSHSKLLSDRGQQTEILTTDEVVELEPAYRSQRTEIAGAIYCPTDETGNAQKFARALAEVCLTKNVNFQFNTRIISLISAGDQIECVTSSNGNIEADLFVVSLGAHTPLLLKSAGLDLPIYPVKGYSLTLPVRADDAPPTIGTVDEDSLVAFAPIGKQFRATATAEFAGYDLSHRPKDFLPMVGALKSLLPNAANYDQPTYRTCLRPMTPQGTPYIGFTRFNNLFVNSGQGHMGWTMACGSAKIAADLISGVEPEIDVRGFQVT